MVFRKSKYYRAIMLIYGNENNNLPDIIRKEIEKVDDKRILIIWHSEANKEPEIIKGNELIKNQLGKCRRTIKSYLEEAI